MHNRRKILDRMQYVHPVMDHGKVKNRTYVYKLRITQKIHTCTVLYFKYYIIKYVYICIYIFYTYILVLY